MLKFYKFWYSIFFYKNKTAKNFQSGNFLRQNWVDLVSTCEYNRREGEGRNKSSGVEDREEGSGTNRTCDEDGRREINEGGGAGMVCGAGGESKENWKEEEDCIVLEEVSTHPFATFYWYQYL